MSDVQLIDSHCHLIFDNFEKDLQDVVLRLRSRGVKKLVHACCELKEIPKIKKFLMSLMKSIIQLVCIRLRQKNGK